MADTGKVFTVRHHRDDQTCADFVGSIKGLDEHNMPRSGDVMVSALQMDEPVPQIAEEIVERPVSRFELHKAVSRLLRVPEPNWAADLLGFSSSCVISGARRRSQEPPSRRMMRRRKRRRSWLGAELRR